MWNDWCEVEFEELNAFLGVALNMGTVYVSHIQNYWSKEFESRIQFFNKIFSRKRFLQIFWMLHLNENASKAQDIRARVQKVNNFIEYLDEKFREYFLPGKEVFIDEAVVKFKGRISFITYNPQKPILNGEYEYLSWPTQNPHTFIAFYHTMTNSHRKVL
ncbi:PiggyBac transposable element-derived protein 4 [Anthophora plagiata]